MSRLRVLQTRRRDFSFVSNVTIKKSQPVPGDDGLLINFGSEIKSLENGHVGGYLVIFSDAADTDLDGDYFTKNTDFGIESGAKSAVWLHHRRPLKTRDNKYVTVKTKIGEGVLTIDEKGVLIDAILYNREEYDEALESMGWSSGTASHLVERKSVGNATEILLWPLGLDASMTPSPAQPRKTAVSLKAYERELAGIDAALETAATEKRWTAAEKKDLPDTSFAYIAAGGEKDADGKTAPRNLRFFPIKNADGTPNASGVRSALRSIPLSSLTESAKKRALKAAAAAAKKLGIEVDDDDDNAAKSLGFTKGMYRDELESRYANLYSLTDVLTCVLYRLDWLQDSADEMGLVIDGPALRQEILAEFAEALEEYFARDEEDEAKSAFEIAVELFSPRTVTKHIDFVSGMVRDFSQRGRVLTAEVGELLARCEKSQHPGAGGTAAGIRGQLEDARASLATLAADIKSASDKVSDLLNVLDPSRKEHETLCDDLLLKYMEVEGGLVAGQSDSISTVAS